MIAQKHSSKWTHDETNFLRTSIKNGKSLEDVMKIISLRTDKAILKKAHEFGYGNHRNKKDGLIYFKNNINHKERRCKNESISTSKEADTIGSEDSSSIPKKAIDVAFYEGSIEFMLQRIEDNKCLHL